MPKTAYLLIILLFFSFEDPKMARVKVTEEISVLLPKGWSPMDGMDFTERYPSVRAPLAAYTNEERMVDFSVNLSATQWPDANMEVAQKFFKASLYNMFDRVEIVSEGIREVNKKKYVFLEFEYTIRGNRTDVSQQNTILNYSHIQYLITPERTLVFSFNCPRRLRQQWQPVAHTVMTSIKIK